MSHKFSCGTSGLGLDLFSIVENFRLMAEKLFMRTSDELPAQYAQGASVHGDCRRVSRRCPMPAGAGFMRRTPSERAVIPRGGGLAICRWLSLGHRAFGALRSDSQQRAVEATPVRTANPPSRRTGPLPSWRRD